MLKFGKEGKFKIVQFTDIHFKLNSALSESVLVFMSTILSDEKPDLVVLTGDMVISKKSTREGWHSIIKPMIDAGIPWVVTLGNHDQEQDLSRDQIYEFLFNLPYNIGDNGSKNTCVPGNYVLKIESSNGTKTEALIYCFDSNDYPAKKEWGKYDWIKFNQIQWYREQSNAIKNESNRILPALAFFHIPLPEYKKIRRNPSTVGRMRETVCSPDVNSGLFSVMLEQKDVMGVFVGHDHSCNYIGMLFDICLAYGCVTGKDCYGCIERGARVIDLFEGERKFISWIYTYDNQKIFRVIYPDSFLSSLGE